MAQGNLKLNKSKSQTKPKNAHKSAKEASITKKGKRVMPPKKRNEVEHKVTMKVSGLLMNIYQYAQHNI